MERLTKQIEFIIEVDKIKNIYRKNFVIESGRHETDAEHSWHLAVMAILLAEHVAEYKLDILKVVKMVLIHDIVEIDAGDTYCFDRKAGLDKEAREKAAANRLFSILPDDQAGEFQLLWEEFEAAVSPEAKFAAALDRLQPLLLHYHTEGKSWKLNSITSDKVIARNEKTRDISAKLGKLVDEIIADSINKGYLAK